MTKRFLPTPQADFPPSVQWDFLPIRGRASPDEGLCLPSGSTWTVLPPGVPRLTSEFRTRVRSRLGLHVAAIGAHDDLAPVGPDAFDSHVLHWLIRTADTLIVWGNGFNAATKQRLEQVLHPARRAVMISTVPEHQWTWKNTMDAHASKNQEIHALMWDASRPAGSLGPLEFAQRNGPLQ